MKDLLVLVPSRGRPGRLRDMLTESLRLSGAETDIAVAYDEDDPARLEYLQLGADLADQHRVFWHTGPRDTLSGWTNWLAGRHARSRGYRAVASLGDDHVPRTEGWDKALLDAIEAMGGTGIAYGNDLLQGEKLATAPVITTDIVAALGWVCLPSLKHYHVDDVWTILGREAHCLAYVPEVTIEHMHPGAGKAGLDATYTDTGGWAGFQLQEHPDYREFKRWEADPNGQRADIRKVRALFR